MLAAVRSRSNKLRQDPALAEPERIQDGLLCPIGINHRPGLGRRSVRMAIEKNE